MIATIPVGTQPRAAAVSPDGTRVYITNIGSGNVSVINTTTNTVIATIGVGSAPQGIIVSPDGSRVYVSNANSDTISIINAVSNTVVSTVNVGTYPEGLCLSPDGALLYVGNSDDQNVSVIKTSDNSLVTKITSGIFFNVTDVLVSQDGKSLYVTNGGTLSVINTLTYGLIKNIAVGSAIEGITLTPDGSKLFVANSGSNNVTVLNTATNDITTTVRVDMQPESVSVSPDGSILYVTNYGSNTVSVINAVTNIKLTTVTVGSHPVSFGNFVTGSLGCAGAPITFKITVTPPAGANIRASAAVGTISACAGQPAASPNIQQILVSANNLSADITATAPAGFEISLAAGIGYTNSLMLAQSGGVVDNVVVYLRSSASAPAGNIAGNVVLSSPALPHQDIPVAGSINALPSLQPVNNQVHANGEATDPVNFISTANNITWVNDTPAIGLAASGAGNIASFTATNTTVNPVKATITATPGPVVPGYAYIANQNDGTVSVIDVTSNTVVATIPVGSHPSRVSVSPDNSRVYVGNYGSNSVSVINTATNSVVSTLNAGTQPFGVSVSPDGSLLYVTNENTANVSVINTASNSIVATVGVGSYPYSVLVNPDGSKAYVINNGSNSVSVINTANNQVTATIKVGVSPIGVAVSPDGNRLYVANSNLGSTSSVSVINTVNNTLIATIPVGLNAYGIAVSPDGSRLYVTNNGSNTISVINTVTASLITTIPALRGAAPTGVSVSPDGSQAYVVNYLLNNVSVISTATNTITANVSVGSGPLSFGNFVTAATGCPGTPVTFTITVTPGINAAAINGTGTLTALSTVYGTPSPAESFTVTGANLTAGISVTPPAGFEVGTDNIGFNKTVSIGNAGTIAATKVYIRLAATTPVGTYSGNIILASAGAANVNITLPNSTVTPAPLTITADNKTKFYQNANPELTATYNGFVNSETSAVLTTLPLITTTATLNSAVGEYPITVGGAAAANYSISYVAGILTINPVLQTKDIPNVFTPNGDGVNDSWNINGLGTYINCTVDVFTRYGQKVFSSVGYGFPWDGKFNNTNVPAGTYYYLINLMDGSKVLSGYVAIIR